MDPPNHVGAEGGIDSYPIEAFAGPLKVFDVRRFAKGRSIPAEVFNESVRPGDVVLVFTGYTPPQTDDAFPVTITLTRAAAEYLASMPVRAFGTDAFSVANLQDTSAVDAETETARAAPIHHSFLSRGIAVYEQLFNVAAFRRSRESVISTQGTVSTGDRLGRSIGEWRMTIADLYRPTVRLVGSGGRSTGCLVVPRRCWPRRSNRGCGGTAFGANWPPITKTGPSRCCVNSAGGKARRRCSSATSRQTSKANEDCRPRGTNRHLQPTPLPQL